MFDALDRNGFGKAEIGNLEILLARVRDHHRIVFWPKKRGFKVFLVQPLPLPLRLQDVRGNAAPASFFLRDNGTETWEQHRRIRSMACLSIVRALWMTDLLAVHGTN